MLDGRDADIALAEYGATLGFNDVLSYSLDDRLAFEVDALYFIPVFSGAGLKVTVRLKPVCKPFPQREKLPFSVFCFDIIIFIF